MPLIRNVTEGRFGLEGTVDFVLFEKEISVVVDKGGTLEFAQACADYLNSLKERVVDQLCAASIRYCNHFLEFIGEPRQRFERSRQILQIIYPNVLIVPCLPDRAAPVVHLELNCMWEPEHGMEWIVRDDRVMYTGPFDGRNPTGDFSGKDSWNFA